MPRPQAEPAVRNSTNVRLRVGLLRTGFRLLGRIAPDLAAAAAERLFFTPPRPRRFSDDKALRHAQRIDVSVEGRRLNAWRWGRGPAVVLLHGWGGEAAQLSAFVAPLVERGLSVVAFDAPGHGRSGRGMSSAPQFASALTAVAKGGVHGIVAHSLGAAATALAMRDGLRVERVVFLAPAADPPAWIAPFAERLGVEPEVLARVRARSERRIQRRWDELSVPALVAGCRAALLVIHDRLDPQVPLRDGQAIAAAWPGARLVETSGCGHNRLLRDAQVVEQATAFVARDAVTRCACGERLEPDGQCEACRLGRELFDRESRWVVRVA